MNCEQTHNDLIFYLDKELSKERMEEVRRHIDECDDCRQFAKVLEQQMQIIEDEKHPDVSPFFFTRLSSQLDKSIPDPVSVRKWPQMAVFSLLLAAAIASGIYMGDHLSAPELKPSTENSLLLMNDFETEPIETFLLYDNESKQ